MIMMISLILQILSQIINLKVIEICFFLFYKSDFVQKGTDCKNNARRQQKVICFRNSSFIHTQCIFLMVPVGSKEIY